MMWVGGVCPLSSVSRDKLENAFENAQWRKVKSESMTWSEIMMWVGEVCLVSAETSLCRAPPQGLSPADSYDMLPKKTSELPHVEKIIYIVGACMFSHNFPEI